MDVMIRLFSSTREEIRAVPGEKSQSAIGAVVPARRVAVRLASLGRARYAPLVVHTTHAEPGRVMSAPEEAPESAAAGAVAVGQRGVEFPAFPFPPYDIQKDLMRHIYATLDAGGVGVFESPTGTVRQGSCFVAARKLPLMRLR
jgi:hypothetical protein